MDDGQLIEVLREASGAAREAIDDLVRAGDAARPGSRPGQYVTDVAADEAALSVLLGAGLGAFSEESGRHRDERELIAVLDPLDGSTNCARGVPWYGISVCVLDDSGLRAAVVANLASDAVYEALRGDGATRDGAPISVREGGGDDEALVIATASTASGSGLESRVLGAAALDICLVAEGVADGFVDPLRGDLAPWDFLGAALVLREAGGVIVDREGRAIENLEAPERLAIVAGASAPFVDELIRLTPLEGSAP